MTERIIQTIILPNGVVVEGVAEYMDHQCLMCSKTAIRFDIPRYEDLPRLTGDKWCWEHVNILCGIAIKVSDERVALEKRLQDPLSLWKPHTWWQARVYLKWWLRRNTK